MSAYCSFQDRKRQVEMVKMTQKFSQKEAVLRRKAEQVCIIIRKCFLIE